MALVESVLKGVVYVLDRGVITIKLLCILFRPHFCVSLQLYRDMLDYSTILLKGNLGKLPKPVKSLFN